MRIGFFRTYRDNYLHRFPNETCQCHTLEMYSEWDLGGKHWHTSLKALGFLFLSWGNWNVLFISDKSVVPFILITRKYNTWTSFWRLRMRTSRPSTTKLALDVFPPATTVYFPESDILVEVIRRRWTNLSLWTFILERIHTKNIRSGIGKDGVVTQEKMLL